MALLSKESILKAEDLRSEVVSVPEWGGDVKVRSMTGLERDRFESSLIEEKGGDVQKNTANLRAKLAACCIVDEAGELLFTDKDVTALGKKSAKALDRVFGVAQSLNGIGVDDVEDLTKN